MPSRHRSLLSIRYGGGQVTTFYCWARLPSQKRGVPGVLGRASCRLRDRGDRVGRLDYPPNPNCVINVLHLHPRSPRKPPEGNNEKIEHAIQKDSPFLDRPRSRSFLNAPRTGTGDPRIPWLNYLPRRSCVVRNPSTRRGDLLRKYRQWQEGSTHRPSDAPLRRRPSGTPSGARLPGSPLGSRRVPRLRGHEAWYEDHTIP